MAVDDAGDFLASTSPASGSWGTPGFINNTSPHEPLTAVSCPSTTLCVATDDHGNAYATTTPTSPNWTLESAIDGTTRLNAISCPATTLCIAVDNSGNVLWSATPGSATWTSEAHQDGSTPITAISCPSTTLCVAVDNTGKLLVSTSPTTTSSWQTSLSTGSAVEAVSCASSALCVAVTANGTVYATGDIVTPPVTWSQTPIDPPGPLAAVSCTAAGVCVLLDQSGNAFASDSPAAGTPVWTKTSVDSRALTAVSCLQDGFCVAADSHGYTIAATLPAPTVVSGAGSASSQTTATVAATVNPNDATLSDCHFDYGTSTAYGSSVPCTVVPNATGGAQAVTATLSGLNAATTYHFRIAASSGVATSDGADATFTTVAPLKASPSLSGTPAVGSALTCKPNVTTTAAETVSYQWLSNTLPIAGATAPSYVIVAANESQHLSCQVTIAGDGGSATATSGFDAVPSESAGKVIETFVGTDTHGASSVSAPVTCSPQAAGSCTIKLLLTATETVRHRSETVTVGSATAAIGAGASRTLSVSLNATGKRILKAKHTLTVTLTVSGTVIGTLTATLQSDKLVLTQKAKKNAAHHTPR